MNPHIQKILDLIQQSAQLSADEKTALSKAAEDADKELEITTFKLDRTEKVKHTTAILLEETIEELEQKRKAVEAQNKELEIESSLERVRTVALSMNKRDDMVSVCRMIAGQLELLNVTEIRNVQTAIFYEEKGTYSNFEYYAFHDKSLVTEVEYKNHPMSAAFAGEMLSGPGKFFTHSLEGKELKDWYAFQQTTNQFVDTHLEVASSLNYYWFSLGPVALGISTYAPLKESEIVLFGRFRNVFELAYRRFLDIEKAAAQAREAQIEAALERVRSRSMAMHKSDELKEVIRLVLEQFIQLKINAEHAGFYIDYKTQDDMHIWLADPNIEPFFAIIPYFDTPTWNSFLEAKTKGTTFHTDLLDFEEKNKFYQSLFKLFIVPEEAKKFYMQCKGLAVSTVLLDNVGLYIENFSAIPYTDEENKILMRFGKVFQQTYTRFLDLQKAEAQAREAQIEIALERVRSRAMAMHSSDELKALIGTVFTELTKLDLALTRCIIWVFEQHTHAARWWMANGEDPLNPMSFFLKYHEHPAYLKFLNEWKNQNVKFVYDLKGQDKINWDDILFNETELKNLPAVVQDGMRSPERVLLSASFNNFGGINVASLEPLSDEHFDILLRFAKVFDLTYTRFLDLQKAEAQAKEAQTEMALEKVRSRTMAMQRSDELAGTAALLFQEFKKLAQQELIQTTIGIYNEEKNEIEFRATDWVGSGEQVNRPAYGSMDEPTLLKPAVTAWRAQARSVVIELTGEALQQWSDYRNKMTGTEIATKFDGGRRIVSIAFFSKGHLSMSSPLPISDDAVKILERFAAVFDGTYTRFLDLQKAEAQAREAQVEASLERVRSRTLAMQRSDELAETAAVLFRQLIHLGIAPNRLYIAIIKDEAGSSEFWITDEDGAKVSSAFETDLNNNPTFKKMLDGWKAEKKSLVIDMEGEELQDYFKYLTSINVPFKGGLSQTRRLQEIAYFSKGFIGMASPEEQPEETLQLLERFAAVFNLTYTRFNDLQVAEAHALQAEQDLIAIKEAKQKAEEALTELQATQKQLIQSEKMASLGELTAGIAHEIQNPLNFVNNFSEVSNELIDEMNAEIKEGNLDEAKAIANDIKQNLEKINHHGKRADAIVKGMLQHSRSSSGQKEPTDINVLADEYLRLAYHGLRAKDKSFNATMKTDFDKSIGNINVIPQDIGRVILNLITNAFYTVDEKKKSGIEGYEPTISVSTKKINGNVEIKVADNGNGIPQKVLDKIFQPFFTTKPTGQGTGLGLSLSYDIVKAHGGEIKVITKENEGTTFIMLLPVSAI